VVASFAIADAAIRATCPACRHVMAVAPAHAPASDVPDEPARARCPKCGAPRGASRGAEDACASCGLAVARMAAYTAARDAAVPQVVADAWRRATEAWTDTARHDELLRVVAVHDSYAWAAGRYRTRGDDVAGRQLDRLRRAAEATLLAGATARPDVSIAPYRATRGVLMVLIVALVVGLVYAMVIRTRTTAPHAPVIPARPLEPGRPVSPSTIR
jgi:hypothetical protein